MLCFQLVILVSGGGTNLQAIMDAIDKGSLENVKIAGVISNNPAAHALERARGRGIPAICVSPKDFTEREAFHRHLHAQIDGLAPDLIVTCGFLVKLPKSITSAYAGRIINIHPSLIPSFCGAGYHGLRVHEAALERGVKITGATVHFVDADLDTGPIIMQKAVAVWPGDTPEGLQRRVMEEAEWIILPQAIKQLVEQKGFP